MAIQKNSTLTIFNDFNFLLIVTSHNARKNGSHWKWSNLGFSESPWLWL